MINNQSINDFEVYAGMAINQNYKISNKFDLAGNYILWVEM